MLARIRPWAAGLFWFATTGIVILDWPALAAVPVVA